MSGYHDIAAKIDGFFTRVSSRHGADMRCDTGCTDCCQVRLTVTPIEASAIRSEIASWDTTRRGGLVTNVATSPPGQCAALDPNGRCLIYAVRPFVCRSHGAPIRMTERSLPVIETCFRNFTHTTPDPDCVLDQTTLSTLVLVANNRDDTRVDLAELLASC